MLGLNKRVLVETYHAVRPVGVSLLAMTILACVMAGLGWHWLVGAVSGVIVLLAAVTACQVHRAVSRLRRQSQDLRESSVLAERHYVDVLRRIVKFVETRDHFSRGRSERIGRLCEETARELGLSAERCEQLGVAGQLHDIGLLAIPEHILSKPGALVNKEMRTVQKHCDISVELLRPLESLKDVLPAIRHHHERMNGTGYPLGLAAEALPLEARILAAADSYDAMTHDRPHRHAISPLEAMRELIRCCPAGYDEQCVRALAKVVNMPALEEAATQSVPQQNATQPATQPATTECVA